jgi:hypothetical protein
MHELTVDEHLMSPNSVIYGICWVRTGGDLDLAPLTIGRYNLSLGCESLEFLVDPLLLNTALSLNKFGL